MTAREVATALLAAFDGNLSLALVAARAVQVAAPAVPGVNFDFYGVVVVVLEAAERDPFVLA